MSTVIFPTQAALFACEALKGHTRLDGSSMYDHAERVATTVSRLFDPLHVDDVYRRDMLSAALLHDVVEDTPVTLEEIAETFNEHVARIVDHLTRREGESYAAFIHRCAKDYDAARIKRADLADNISTLQFGDKRWDRYPRALADLNMVVRQYHGGGLAPMVPAWRTTL